MNAVLGICRLLAETALSLEQQQYLQMITGSGQLLLSIINDILVRWEPCTARCFCCAAL
jgi:signal transduction histidine kinase